MPKIKCKVCNGDGLKLNPTFQICQTMNKKDLKLTGISRPGDCSNCPKHIKEPCYRGEIIECWNCEADPVRKFDDDYWELMEDK